jgi:hypothetical protein
MAGCSLMLWDETGQGILCSGERRQHGTKRPADGRFSILARNGFSLSGIDRSARPSKGAVALINA